jgi:hypothetical protein
VLRLFHTRFTPFFRSLLAITITIKNFITYSDLCLCHGFIILFVVRGGGVALVLIHLVAFVLIVILVVILIVILINVLILVLFLDMISSLFPITFIFV